jgi:hypothetical protein
LVTARRAEAQFLRVLAEIDEIYHALSTEQQIGSWFFDREIDPAIPYMDVPHIVRDVTNHQ